MIVKNEASSIEDVLRNALPFVDQWMIVDTGSTDGTQASSPLEMCSYLKDIIRRVTSEFPNVFGRLEEEPFKDFRC